MALATSAVAAQQSNDTSTVWVGVRPDRVRVGDLFVVTVRVRADVWPTAVDLDPGLAAEIIDYDDRTSTRLGSGGGRVHVLERDFRLKARVPGQLRLAGALVELHGTLIEASVPGVEAVGSPIEWASAAPPAARRRGRDGVRPADEPPASRGRDYSANGSRYPSPYGWPGPGSPYGWQGPGWPGGVVPGMGPGTAPGYGMTGYYDAPLSGGTFGGYNPWGALPPGESWAENAASDPYWAELIPEIFRFDDRTVSLDGLAGVDVGVTPMVAYVGQQVTSVTSVVLPPEAQYQADGYPRFMVPSAEGAWVVDLPYAPPAAQARDGRAQTSHSYARAFFPTNAGQMVIVMPTAEDPSPQGVSVEVRPIPQGEAPPDWRGVVGRYEVAAWVSPERVSWAEPAVLTVELRGAGHLPSQPRPDPGPIWGGGLRPLGDRTWVEVRDGVVGGVKRYKWLVVPGEEGLIRIGPVVLSYFDPWVGAFQQVASDEVVLEVDPIGAPTPR
jgi:hypothetical protein